MAATFATFKDSIIRACNKKGWAVMDWSHEDYGRGLRFDLEKNNKKVSIMVNVPLSVHRNKVVFHRIEDDPIS